MSVDKPLALVAGAGPGLGQALMGRFNEGGMTPVGLGRSRPANSVGAFHQIDLTDEQPAAALIADIIAEHGPPKIVVHNTAELVISPFEKTTLADYRQTWASMVETLVVLARSVLQPMVQNNGGSLIVSGATASLRGGSQFSAFASAKFALRGLTQSLAREYQPEGVHVAHVILDGIIDTHKSRELHSLDPARMMKPTDISEAYWQLAQQPKSAWVHEMDLRPATENF